MPRSRRLKVKGEESYYHIMSRTVGQQYFLGDVEKERLLSIIKHFSGFYFVKVIGFCIMSNHFHLLIKSDPGDLYADPEVVRRVVKYTRRNADQLSGLGIQKYREKLEDISEFVRSVKQAFSVWYNRHYHRTGYFWGDRFKSVLIEEGESLLSCLAYIDLNPLRAGMVKIPEEYRWSSFSYWTAKGKGDGFLSFAGIFERCDVSTAEVLSYYRYLIYTVGNRKKQSLGDLEAGIERPRISNELYEKELKRWFSLPKHELLLKRIRYFSDGLVIGSKEFIQRAYQQFGGVVIHKKDRGSYETGLGEKILSLRRLKTCQPGS